MTDDPVTSYLTEQFGEPAQEQTDVPRDELGRFASTEETPEETPEPEAPAETIAEPTSPPELILGKYKTNDDALKALEHSQSHIGRLEQQIGELQKRFEEPAQQQYDLSSVDESIGENPQLAQQAAVIALQQGDRFTYERIINAWGEQDPFSAARFDARVAAFEQNQQAMAQVAPQIQSAQDMAQRGELESALGNVAGRHEDFAAVVGSLDENRLAEIVQGGFPKEVLNGLTGSQQSKEAVFETLYRWVKADQADLLGAAAAQANAQQETEANDAKRQAAVANATSPPVSEGTGDKALDEFYDFMRAPSPTSWLS